MQVRRSVLVSCTMLFCLAIGNFRLFFCGTVVPCAGVVAALARNRPVAATFGDGLNRRLAVLLRCQVCGHGVVVGRLRLNRSSPRVATIRW